MNIKYAMRSEDIEQINVINWAKCQLQIYPELKWLYHIPNGGSRYKAEAVKLKQMGVKAGVSDLCLPYPKGIYCGLYIEMKYDKGRLQDTQKEFLHDMAEAGHYVATCYTAEETIKVIEEYVNLIDGNGIKSMFIQGGNKAMMSVQNNSIWKGDEVKPLKVQNMNEYAAAVRQQVIKIEEENDIDLYKRATEAVISWANSKKEKRMAAI